MPPYATPRPLAVAVYDQPAVSFGTDWASIAQSRPVSFFSDARSWASGVYDQPASIFGTDWASVVLSRVVPYYVAPADRIFMTVAPTPDTYSAVYAPRTQPGYVTPPSRVVAALDNPTAPAAYAILVANRIADYYQGAPSSITPADFSVSVVVPDVYVAPVRTRIVTVSIPSPISRVIIPVSDGVIILLNQGGGGEWVIWERPDFPGNRPGAWQSFNRPDFKRPSRREKRGY